MSKNAKKDKIFLKNDDIHLTIYICSPILIIDNLLIKISIKNVNNFDSCVKRTNCVRGSLRENCFQILDCFF